MFCDKCGKELKISDKFCTECGAVMPAEKEKPTPEDKWYLRLAKVIYIVLYIPLPFVLWGVWTSNDPYSYYSSYSREWISYGSYGEAFWYSLLTLVIWVVILRLIKIAVLYVATGRKISWRMEFKKFF